MDRLWAASAVFAVGVLAGCSGDSTSDPTEVVTVGSAVPGRVDITIASSPGRQPEGFTTVTARITGADGEVCEVCVWLADTSEERARGLMEVTDLGDAAGMAFSYDEPAAGTFYMFQTPTPLSIAWFDPDGDHLGSTDMAPCLDTAEGECTRYSPGAEYSLALEVFEGGLADLGVAPGARLELLDGTQAERCPITSQGSAAGSPSVSVATP